jgi:hypothetical protein
MSLKDKIFGELLYENPKSFWSYTRELQGKTSTVDYLSYNNGEVVTKNIEKANSLNKYFENVYYTEDSLHKMEERTATVSISPKIRTFYYY